MKIRSAPLLLIVSLLGSSVSLLAGGKKNQVDPNPNFQEMMKTVTRIVVRDGGDICCVSKSDTLKQKIMFEITDEKKILKFSQNVVFQKGTSKNGCFCCGRPGLDLYAGERRVFLSGIKHGSGLMKESTIAWFKPKTKQWIKEWLIENGLTEDQIK